VVRLGGQLIVNPGSIGCPAYLDDREVDPFVAETGSGDARYAIFEKVGEDWIPSLVHVPYDATEMMARARSNGADSWAEAISTGWITLPS
jgi:diadenosine tetraphosphatase ApaH/serine/threonine PP2A family protein phosphatase